MPSMTFISIGLVSANSSILADVVSQIEMMKYDSSNSGVFFSFFLFFFVLLFVFCSITPKGTGGGAVISFHVLFSFALYVFFLFQTFPWQRCVYSSNVVLYHLGFTSFHDG